MGYIDITYYKSEYKGEITGDEQLEKYIERASEKVDMLTHYVLKGHEFTNLATFLQEQVKKATAAQTEFYVLNGGDTTFNTSDDMQNVSIGSFSYQTNNNSSVKNDVSERAIELLSPTGLLYSGIGVVHRG